MGVVPQRQHLFDFSLTLLPNYILLVLDDPVLLNNYVENLPSIENFSPNTSSKVKIIKTGSHNEENSSDLALVGASCCSPKIYWLMVVNE